MNASAQWELQQIKNDLRGIISDLQNISKGIRRDFTGIGNDLCANCIDKVVQNYQSVLNRLNSMNTNEVTEQFLKTHPIFEQVMQ